MRCRCSPLGASDDAAAFAAGWRTVRAHGTGLHAGEGVVVIRPPAALAMVVPKFPASRQPLGSPRTSHGDAVVRSGSPGVSTSFGRARRCRASAAALFGSTAPTSATPTPAAPTAAGTFTVAMGAATTCAVTSTAVAAAATSGSARAA